MFNTNFTSVQRFFGRNLPTTTGGAILDIIVAANYNGTVFSEVGNPANPTTSGYYLMEVSTYNAVIHVLAKGATAEIDSRPLLYHGVYVNEKWPGWIKP